MCSREGLLRYLLDELGMPTPEPCDLISFMNVVSRNLRTPTVILMHHPPFVTGIGHMDNIGFAKAGELEGIVRRHPQIERILCGHLHRPIHVRFGGTVASTCPSPAHQVVLDLDPDAPSRFLMEPPSYQLHLWRDGTGLVSHTALIGDFAGPYPFHDATR